MASAIRSGLSAGTADVRLVNVADAPAALEDVDLVVACPR
jgi:hypothetical protein